MRIDAIRSFLKLVEAGSYAAAADALYMSATTLHSHVKTLEEELNTTLVSFEGRRMDLTRAGSQFLLFAERTVAEYDSIREQISGIRRSAQAVLRVVSLAGPGNHLLPPVVAGFQRDHPDVHVIVDTRRTGEAIAALVSRQADVAIVHDAHAAGVREVFEVALVFQDRLAAVIRNELYGQPDIALLERYPLAVQPAPSFSRQYVEQWARQQNVRLHAQYEHASFDGILANVVGSDCIGIVGGYLTALSPLAGMVRALDLPRFEHVRRIAAVYPARASETVVEFVNYFRTFYEAGALVRARS